MENETFQNLFDPCAVPGYRVSGGIIIFPCIQMERAGQNPCLCAGDRDVFAHHSQYSMCTECGTGGKRTFSDAFGSKPRKMRDLRSKMAGTGRTCNGSSSGSIFTFRNWTRGASGKNDVSQTVSDGGGGIVVCRNPTVSGAFISESEVFQGDIHGNFDCAIPVVCVVPDGAWRWEMAMVSLYVEQPWNYAISAGSHGRTTGGTGGCGAGESVSVARTFDLCHNYPMVS